MQNVLIVDANSLFRKWLKETLHSRSRFHIVTEAKNREEALQVVTQSLPHLILLDIQLPDGNGLELARLIKSTNPSVKVVVLTNYDQPEYRDAAYRYKVDHYVPKDLFMEMVYSVLSETPSVT